ncbi:MAG: hypothetical protein ABW328_11770, partial [Ilumatobacteraceae bacterium]
MRRGRLVERLGRCVAGLVTCGIGIALIPTPSWAWRRGTCCTMTGLARHGLSIRATRTEVELAALAVGFALGGSVGVGTAASPSPSVRWCRLPAGDERRPAAV